MVSRPPAHKKLMTKELLLQYSEVAKRKVCQNKKTSDDKGINDDPLFTEIEVECFHEGCTRTMIKKVSNDAIRPPWFSCDQCKKRNHFFVD